MFNVPPPSFRPTGPGASSGPTAPRVDPEALTPELVDTGTAPMPQDTTGIPNAAPPSTYAVVDFLDGGDGSAVRLAGLTMLRTVFILPGLWVASKATSVPLTFGQLAGFSLASSTTITVGMVGYYAFKRRRAAMRASA